MASRLRRRRALLRAQRGEELARRDLLLDRASIVAEDQLELGQRLGTEPAGVLAHGRVPGNVLEAWHVERIDQLGRRRVHAPAQLGHLGLPLQELRLAPGAW